MTVDMPSDQEFWALVEGLVGKPIPTLSHGKISTPSEVTDDWIDFYEKGKIPRGRLEEEVRSLRRNGIVTTNSDPDLTLQSGDLAIIHAALKGYTEVVYDPVGVRLTT